MNILFSQQKMDNDLPIDTAFEYLKKAISHEAFPSKFLEIVTEFAQQYITICKEHSTTFQDDVERLKTYLHFVRENTVNPFQFPPYHEAIRSPFDYHSLANNLVRPLVDFKHSTLQGIPTLETIQQQCALGENVVLFANHQSEADPQALSLLLEAKFPALSAEMIFVAGSRVTTDPMAIPFSMGCNLLCIYSKRHIENPPEEKQKKQKHNQKTMGVLRTLLQKGGVCIYVAPSGGRDRKNEEGNIEVAPFDSDSIALFHLLAKKAKTPTHFYPLALSTYSLLPPPPVVEKELGERRTINWCPIHARFLSEIDMENYPGSDIPVKEGRRRARAEYIHTLVKEAHTLLT